MGRKILAGLFLDLIKFMLILLFSILCQRTASVLYITSEQFFQADKKDFFRLYSGHLGPVLA